mgnify:CR=1 FL=1
MSIDRSSVFQSFAKIVSNAAGRPAAFITALTLIVGWIVSGPMFGYSDTWQLVINTGTTIITFLMVFLIQNSQNRDTKALQIKLDELIRVTEGAHNALLDLEELTEEEINAICGRYERIARNARSNMRQGEKDTHIPEVELD